MPQMFALRSVVSSEMLANALRWTGAMRPAFGREQPPQAVELLRDGFWLQPHSSTCLGKMVYFPGCHVDAFSFIAESGEGHDRQLLKRNALSSTVRAVCSVR